VELASEFAADDPLTPDGEAGDRSLSVAQAAE
jgi:hypothetical protein